MVGKFVCVGLQLFCERVPNFKAVFTGSDVLRGEPNVEKGVVRGRVRLQFPNGGSLVPGELRMLWWGNFR